MFVVFHGVLVAEDYEVLAFGAGDGLHRDAGIEGYQPAAVLDGSREQRRPGRGVARRHHGAGGESVGQILLPGQPAEYPPMVHVFLVEEGSRECPASSNRRATSSLVTFIRLIKLMNNTEQDQSSKAPRP